MIFSITKSEIKRLFAYPLIFFLREFLPFVAALPVPVLLWQNATPSDTQVFWYFLFSMTAYQIFTPEPAYISREVYDGTVTRYFLYPHSFSSIIFSRYLGYLVCQLFLGLLFIILVAALWQLPVTLEGFLKFLLLTPFCVGLSFLLFSLVEAVTLWLEDGWTFRVMLEVVAIFLAGRFLKLEHLPSIVEAVAQTLPFKFMAYIPSVALLNNLSWFEVSVITVQGLAWLLVLSYVFHLFLNEGLRHFSAFGS